MPEILIAADVLEEEIQHLAAKIDEWEEWDGKDAPAVKRARWLLAGVRRGMERALERYVSTRAAARVSGWNAQTLQARARTLLAGGELPPAWAGLRAKQGPNGYSFLLSSVPLKGGD